MAMPRVLSCVLLALLSALPASGQEARRRWEMQRQIRLDKFDQILPLAMRHAGIDMWIVAVKENHYDPLWEDLGRGYVSGIGYYVFTDRGRDRIERAALGPSGYLLEQSGAYDVFAAASTLQAFVKERNPKRIGVNMSHEIGPADGLSFTMHQHLVKTLGEPYASRLVSAETLVSEFRSKRVAAEIVAFGEAAGIAIQLAERALSNEVITPGKTTLEQVAWWMQDRLLERGLGSEFDMPSVYITGPEGIAATSNARIIQPGDVMMIDWGVQLMNFGTDVKRVAYVLKPGEIVPPKSIQNAFDRALAVRDVLKKADQAWCASRRDHEGDGRCTPRRRLRGDRVQPPQRRRQDRRRVRLPSGREHRPRHWPVTDYLAAAAADVHAAPAAHVRVRVLCLHADRRMGRQEAPYPDRRRCHPDGARDPVSASGELQVVGDSIGLTSGSLAFGAPRRRSLVGVARYRSLLRLGAPRLVGARAVRPALVHSIAIVSRGRHGRGPHEGAKPRVLRVPKARVLRCEPKASEPYEASVGEPSPTAASSSSAWQREAESRCGRATR